MRGISNDFAAKVNPAIRRVQNGRKLICINPRGHGFG
jgi:hypothetical protein